MNLKSNRILIILSISIFVFCFIALLVSSGSTANIDDLILLSFRQNGNTSIPVGPAWLMDFMTDISSLGSVSIIVAVTLFVSGCMIVKKNFNLLWIILFAAIGGGLLDLLLKYLFARPRPEIVPHLVNVESWSFPSGHSVMSAVIYLSLAVIFIPVDMDRSIKKYILTSAVIISFLIGVSRIYLGVHYPSDVLAGWMLGTAWCCISMLLAERLTNRKLSEITDG